MEDDLRVSFYVCVTALAVAGFPAMAQDDQSSASTAELVEKLNSQKLVTRGLSMIRVEKTGDSNDPENTLEVAPPATAHIEFDPSDQINISIAFDHDSAVLRDDQKGKLGNLCDALNNVEIERFRIIGHTDASGSSAYNEQQSRLRAEEVKRHLVSDCGLQPAKLEPLGGGEAHPLEGQDPYADENRRVEFQLLG